MQRKATLFAALLMLLGLTISPPQACRAADEDPLQDFCVALNANDQQITINGLLCKPAAEVKANDFASQQLRNPGMFSAKLGSAVNLASATTFGALNTQGLSIARIDFKPKGVNPPHVHPRATEVLFLAQGTLVVGFVSTAPQNRLFFKTIHAGDLFVFPRGLPHFQFNPSESKPAFAIAALNSQNPGVSQLAVALFASNPPLPEEVLEITLGVGDEELHRLIRSVQEVSM